MILVDEYLALLRLADQGPEQIRSEPLALTYSRAYRLTRALLDPGPGRLAVRGRFTRLVDALSPSDQAVLHDRLADPDPAILTIVDPRPTVRTAGAIQNTYAGIGLIGPISMASSYPLVRSSFSRQCKCCTTGASWTHFLSPAMGSDESTGRSWVRWRQPSMGSSTRTRGTRLATGARSESFEGCAAAWVPPSPSSMPPVSLSGSSPPSRGLI